MRLEGDAAARYQAIDAFSNRGSRDGPRVLLLSSKNNASGTNLQARKNCGMICFLRMSNVLVLTK